jgi:hypothetical protein
LPLPTRAPGQEELIECLEGRTALVATFRRALAFVSHTGRFLVVGFRRADNHSKSLEQGIEWQRHEGARTEERSEDKRAGQGTGRRDLIKSGKAKRVESLRCRCRLRRRRSRSRAGGTSSGRARTGPPFCSLEHLARQDEHPPCFDPEQTSPLELAWAARLGRWRRWRRSLVSGAAGALSRSFRTRRI